MTRKVIEVADGVLVATSRRYLTNTTFVLAAGAGIVVDPAWDADELAAVAGVLQDRGGSIAAGLSTHVHEDHVMWHPTLGNVPRWASPWATEQWEHHREERLAPLVGDLPESLLPYVGRLTPLGLERRPAATRVPWVARELLLHEHDAHAPCHLAVEIPDCRVLLAGDMLSDVELPMPEEAETNLTGYLEGLDRLAQVVSRTTMLVPGHGTPTDKPLARLDADRRYLDDLLSGRASSDPRIALPDMGELHATNLRRARH